MPNFSFDTFSLEDPEAKDLYHKALVSDAKRFWKWRREHPARLKQGVDGAFNAWWLLIGPIAFKLPRDAARYKEDLLEVVTKELSYGN